MPEEARPRDRLEPPPKEVYYGDHSFRKIRKGFSKLAAVLLRTFRGSRNTDCNRSSQRAFLVPRLMRNVVTAAGHAGLDLGPDPNEGDGLGDDPLGLREDPELEGLFGVVPVQNNRETPLRSFSHPGLSLHPDLSLR